MRHLRSAYFEKMPRLAVKVFPVRCETCRLPIKARNDWVRDLGHMVFHLECFCCFMCKAPIASQAQFAIRNRRPVCERDFPAVVAAEEAGTECGAAAAATAATTSGGEQPKVKRHRTVITEDQINELKRQFLINSTPDGHTLANIALSIGLTKKIVQVWFQNRRARKRKEEQQMLNAVTSTTPETERMESDHQ